MDESLIDEAKRIQFMKRLGLAIPQVADWLCINMQNVVNRLRLLRLPPRGAASGSRQPVKQGQRIQDAEEA